MKFVMFSRTVSPSGETPEFTALALSLAGKTPKFNFITLAFTIDTLGTELLIKALSRETPELNSVAHTPMLVSIESDQFTAAGRSLTMQSKQDKNEKDIHDSRIMECQNFRRQSEQSKTGEEHRTCMDAKHRLLTGVIYNSWTVSTCDTCAS